MSDKRVTVKVCNDPFEAVFLRSYLEDNGISAIDTYEHQSSWTGRYALLSRGIQLRVLPRDAPRARALLASVRLPDPGAEEEVPDAGADTIEAGETFALNGSAGEPARCPNCGSANIRKVSSSPGLRWFTTLVLLLGLPLLLGRKAPVWVCDDCEWNSQGSGAGPRP